MKPPLLRNGDSGTNLGPAADSLKELIGLQSESAAGKRNDVLAADDLAARGILLVSVLALLVVVVVAYVLSQRIARGVGQVARAAVGLAQGDLNQTLDVRSGDEIGQLANGLPRYGESPPHGDHRYPGWRQRSVGGEQ